ncbi:MAG: hypothetical protein AB1489_32185 [Acidobacteriota bacterium]
MKPFDNETIDTANTNNTKSANAGYALGQLAKAFAANQTHEDKEVRTRAEKKIENWIKVFKGMLSGLLQVGSRTPVAGMPNWVTLEVVKGGFATGNALADGPLQAHEEELLKRLSIVQTGIARSVLNSYFLSEIGLQELRSMLKNGSYRINVPEEGALLVVAWLIDQSRFDEARALLDEIGPHFSKLRFYPVPNPQPLTMSPVVYLQDVRQTIKDLQKVDLPVEIQKQEEAIEIWIPLYDRVVELFVETIEGSAPSLKTDSNGKPLMSEAGVFQVEGGWPCQIYPEGWHERAKLALDEYSKERAKHQLCDKPERQSENFSQLREYLKKGLDDPGKLSGRDVAIIRRILAAINSKRGLPSSERCQHLRQAQTRQVAGPTSVELARVLIERLKALPQEQGLNSLEEVLVPISLEESEKFKIAVGEVFPEYLTEKISRCLEAPIEVLVDKGIVTSGEVLAKVIPQLTSQIRAAVIEDDDLRRLYGAIYRAFSRRRSLLLLNLESQVKLKELPWAKAIDAYRKESLNAQEQALETLKQLVIITVSTFPQQIVPNKLLQEIRSLAESARLQFPIVDEVAADIFMGEFSEKFLRAAQKAGELLEGTLYEKYYRISYAKVKQINDVKPSHYGAATSPEFLKLCCEMAGESITGFSWSVARNGKIIEQEQILTTHNLAVLFDGLKLKKILEPALEKMARGCFEWICNRQQQKIDQWKARLQMIKNTAYAWRQMIFFLSLMPNEGVEKFLSWANEHLGKQRPEYQIRFRSVLEGLFLVSKGISLDDQIRHSNEVVRFLGWTTEKHWLL